MKTFQAVTLAAAVAFGLSTAAFAQSENKIPNTNAQTENNVNKKPASTSTQGGQATTGSGAMMAPAGAKKSGNDNNYPTPPSKDETNKKQEGAGK